MNSNNNKVKRLKMIMDSLGMNQTEFGAKIGIPQANVSALISGNRKLTKAMESRFIIQYDINPIWFETGEGEMFLDAKGVENARTVTVSAAEHDALLRDLEVMRVQIREITRDKNYFLGRVQDLEAELKKTAARPASDASCAAAG